MNRNVCIIFSVRLEEHKAVIYLLSGRTGVVEEEVLIFPFDTLLQCLHFLTKYKYFKCQ